MSADRGGRLVDHLHASGAAKQIDRAAKRAGYHDPVHAHLSGPQTAVLIFASEHSGWIAGTSEIAHLTGGISGASAAIRQLVDIGLASQSAPTAPVVLTPLGQQRAAQLRGSD